MAEETWHAARLIPTSGISGAEEQERRATSAVLAVMTSVREFGRAVLAPMGAPSGPIETFIEVPFDLDGHRIYPDGVIRVTRGKTTWTALVEVKTGTNALQAAQLEQYLDVAKLNGYDALVTISNEIPSAPGEHPTSLDKRKLRKVALHHRSWTAVLTEAVMQKVHRGVSDPDQAWILGELIRYLEHPRSGAMEFSDMGESWVAVRNAVAAGTLRASDKGAVEVAGRWDQLIGYLCLRLGRELGIEVQAGASRRGVTEPAARTASVVSALVDRGTLEGALRIPNTVGPIGIEADVRAARLTATVELAAPKEGRAQTRVNWLLRQLRNAPETLRLDAYAAHARGASTSALLRDARNEPALLVADPKRELRAFTIALTVPMGSKRGRGRGAFIDSVVDLVDDFYGQVVQGLKSWNATPPKLRAKPEEEDPAGPLTSTALSSQDGPEPATAKDDTHAAEGQTPHDPPA